MKRGKRRIQTIHPSTRAGEGIEIDLPKLRGVNHSTLATLIPHQINAGSIVSYPEEQIVHPPIYQVQILKNTLKSFCEMGVPHMRSIGS